MFHVLYYVQSHRCTCTSVIGFCLNITSWNEACVLYFVLLPVCLLWYFSEGRLGTVKYLISETDCNKEAQSNDRTAPLHNAAVQAVSISACLCLYTFSVTVECLLMGFAMHVYWVYQLWPHFWEREYLDSVWFGHRLVILTIAPSNLNVGHSLGTAVRLRTYRTWYCVM